MYTSDTNFTTLDDLSSEKLGLIYECSVNEREI